MKLFLAVLLLTTLVAAQDIRIRDRTQDARRDTTIRRSNDGVEIESNQREGRTRDWFRMNFGKGGQKSIEIRLDQSSQVNDTRTSFSFRLRMFALVEFNDTNGNGQFDIGTDYVCRVNRITNDNFDYSAISSATADGIAVRTVSGYSTDNNNLFTVVMHVSMGDGPFSDRGRTIYPTSAKFDIIITPQASGYAYSCNNPRFAIVSKAKSRQSSRSRDDSPSTGVTYSRATTVEFGVDAVNGFFTWALTANATGSNGGVSDVNVNFSGLSDDNGTPTFPRDDDIGNGETSKIAVYSFDVVAPRRIEWDPELGYTATSNGFIARVGFISVALTILMAVFFL